MCAWVSTTRRTGGPSSATAAAKGSHCDRTMSVSMTVNPSSSATTPALLIPEPPPGCNHAQTPSLSFSSSTPRQYRPGRACQSAGKGRECRPDSGGRSDRAGGKSWAMDDAGPRLSGRHRRGVRRAELFEPVSEVGVGRTEVEAVDGDHSPPGFLLDPVEPFVVGDPEPGPVVLIAVVLQQYLPLDNAEVGPGEESAVVAVHLNLPLRRREPPLLQ